MIFKLRTMRQIPGGLRLTAADDARVTAVGKFLRKTKLDELPTLWNVLKGDISLVGPRPEVPQYVDKLNPTWHFVLSVKPGLVDPVTLQLRNEEKLLASVQGSREHFYLNYLQPYKLQGYAQYLRTRSWRSDLGVLFRTLIVVLLPSHAGLLNLEVRQLGLTDKKSWRD
jgi:lipopolysaccharide/colanic/teichoic acid biosynthesis glycosyltransferase